MFNRRNGIKHFMCSINADINSSLNTNAGKYWCKNSVPSDNIYGIIDMK